MPRDSNGTYTLPSPENPVASSTVIESDWANTTVGDIADVVEDSLSRSGRGAMTAPLEGVDGMATAPGLAFSAEPMTGWYRAGSGDVRAAIAGVDAYRFKAFGLANAIYSGVSFTSAFSTVLYLAFNPAGTKMFVLGSIADTVYQYTLSTGFDVSTASYDSVSFSVAGQDTSSTGIAFNSDGTKMFMVGLNTDSVYQYTLSTGFDVSTASYDSVAFSISGESNFPGGLAFNPTGTAMFILGANAVYQYTLSVGFNVSTAVYSGESFSVAGQENNPRAFAFNAEGTSMYVVGINSDSVHHYTLSSGFDISTASYSGEMFSVAAQTTAPSTVTFSTDASKMYVADANTSTIYQYDVKKSLLEVWDATDDQWYPVVDLNTALLTDTGTQNLVDALNARANFNESLLAANYLSEIAANGTTAQQMSRENIGLDVQGFYLKLAVYTGISFSVSAQDSDPRDITFNPTGTKMFMVGRSTDTVYQYTLATEFDLKSASYSGVSFSVAAQDTDPRDLAFNPDGTRMFVLGTAGNTVDQYNLSTGFDLSTVSYSGVSFSVAGQETDPTGIDFNTDGTKMFVIGADSDAVREYTLSTGFDLSTASYSGVSFSVAGQEITPTGLAFSSMGTKMFIVGVVNDTIFEYNLITGFDLSTAYYAGVSFSVASQEADTPSGLTFSATGTEMFVVGSGTDAVYQYVTSTILLT